MKDNIKTLEQADRRFTVSFCDFTEFRLKAFETYTMSIFCGVI
jgi:hypothetical protein